MLSRQKCNATNHGFAHIVGTLKKFQNLSFLHMFVALLQEAHFPI